MNRRVDGHFARKRFGQNFLTDERIIAAIVAAFAPVRGQNVVEIGPGLGAITRELLAHLGRVHVVEVDRDLAAALPMRLLNEGELVVHEADALKFDFRTLATGPHSLRVIGNLPYNISTPLIFHLLGFAGQVSDMCFMLQKEVVDRLAAEPGTPDYGRLGVMVQYRCRVDWLLGVPPGAFNPPPKVQSAVVRLTPYDKPPYTCDNEALLGQVVAAAFNQRRKTLRNALKSLATDDDFAAVGIDPGLRGEVLSVEQFVRLTNRLNTHVPH